MANEEQLAILRQGVEVWNEWRTENLDVEVDLSGANLSGADLARADLSGSSFLTTYQIFFPYVTRESLLADFLKFPLCFWFNLC